MDDRFNDRFGPPPGKSGSDRLADVYKAAFAKRYGIEPLVDANGKFILQSLLTACVENGRGESFAIEMVETFPTIDDEWFLKTSHSLMALKGGMATVIAAMGAKRKGAASMKGVTARNPIETLLYYLFESVMWQENRKLIRTGDEIITQEGHHLSRESLRLYLQDHWHPAGTDEMGELCEVLDNHLKELRAHPPTPEAL